MSPPKQHVVEPKHVIAYLEQFDKDTFVDGDKVAWHVAYNMAGLDKTLKLQADALKMCETLVAEGKAEKTKVALLENPGISEVVTAYRLKR